MNTLPGEEFGVQCFCVSISHSFFFPNGISSDRMVKRAPILVLNRRRLPHEAGRATVLGTNF